MYVSFIFDFSPTFPLRWLHGRRPRSWLFDICSFYCLFFLASRGIIVPVSPSLNCLLFHFLFYHNFSLVFPLWFFSTVSSSRRLLFDLWPMHFWHFFNLRRLFIPYLPLLVVEKEGSIEICAVVVKVLRLFLVKETHKVATSQPKNYCQSNWTNQGNQLHSCLTHEISVRNEKIVRPILLRNLAIIPSTINHD